MHSSYPKYFTQLLLIFKFAASHSTIYQIVGYQHRYIRYWQLQSRVKSNKHAHLHWNLNEHDNIPPFFEHFKGLKANATSETRALPPFFLHKQISLQMKTIAIMLLVLQNDCFILNQCNSGCTLGFLKKFLCICVCVYPEAINNQWHDMNPI